MNEKLLGHALLTTNDQNIYTVPSSTKTLVERIYICAGTTNGTITITHYVNADATNRLVVQAATINTGEKSYIIEGLRLAAGDIIKAKAPTGANINITIYGIERPI